MLRLLLFVGLTLSPTASLAIQKKQCKTAIFVTGESRVYSSSSAGQLPNINWATKSARYKARQAWRLLASATHGPAYGNESLAKNFKIGCAQQGMLITNIVCSANGSPCRIDNAPPPSRIQSRKVN